MGQSQKSIRVCFVSQKFPRDGVAAEYGYLWPLCRQLADQGHDVTVITTESQQEPSIQNSGGIQIHYLEGSFGDNTTVEFRESVLDRLEQLHVENPFDLVHSVDSAGLNIAFHREELELPLAVDVKGIQLDQIFGLLGLTEETPLSYIKTSFAVASRFLKSFFGDDRKLLKEADGIFVTSPQQCEILERYYYIPARKIHIIPYGIDGKSFEPEQTKEKIAKELEIDPETKIVMTISPFTNIEETKNLLTAFERVVIKKPKTALIIVGDGPKRRDIELHMLNLALASKVHFTGHISPTKIHEYINASDIYVNLYSKSSGFEPTVLEAMACCKTVIASEVGTSSNVIENGVDGFLVRPTEISALSRLMLEAVSGQIDTKSIGERTRQKILKMFDTTRMVNQTIQAYQEILAATGKNKR